MQTIGERISLIIRNSALSKTRFSERLNVSPAFISQICSGARIPSDRTIADICREFYVSEAWLRDGVGEMYVTRTMNQEIAMLVNDLMADADDSFRKRFVAALLELPLELWPELERFIKKISQDGE